MWHVVCRSCRGSKEVIPSLITHRSEVTPSSFFPEPGHMGTLALYRARDEEGLLGAQKPLVGLSMAPLLGTAIMLLTVKKQCGWGKYS